MHFIKGVLRWFYNSFNFLWNFAVLKLNNVAYDSYPRINGRIFIRNKGRVLFGKGVRINSGLRHNPIGGDSRTIIIVHEGGQLKIGDGVGISNSCIVCRDSVEIAKNVYIGGSSKIYDNDFHSLKLEYRLQQPDPDIRVKAVNISEGAFIGAFSIILKGSNIGSESVIGAGSVVSGYIPPEEIWAGNPAKWISNLKDKESNVSVEK